MTQWLWNTILVTATLALCSVLAWLGKKDSIRIDNRMKKYAEQEQEKQNESIAQSWRERGKH